MGCRVDRPAVLRVGGDQKRWRSSWRSEGAEHGAERTSSLQERDLYDFDVRYVGCLRPILVEFRPCVSLTEIAMPATRTNTVDHDC